MMVNQRSFPSACLSSSVVCSAGPCKRTEIPFPCYPANRKKKCIRLITIVIFLWGISPLVLAICWEAFRTMGYFLNSFQVFQYLRNAWIHLWAPHCWYKERGTTCATSCEQRQVEGTISDFSHTESHTFSCSVGMVQIWFPVYARLWPVSTVALFLSKPLLKNVEFAQFYFCI